MAQITHPGAISDWYIAPAQPAEKTPLFRRLFNGAGDGTNPAETLQALFDTLDQQPDNIETLDKILEALPRETPRKGDLAHQAGYEVMRRFTGEYIPEANALFRSGQTNGNYQEGLQRAKTYFSGQLKGRGIVNMGPHPGRPPLPSETALHEMNQPFRRRNGQLVVEGDVNLSDHGLEMLPDYSNVIVTGNFFVVGNNLKTLAGSPKSVGGDYSCTNNRLETLEGATQDIGGSFTCAANMLKDLRHGPQNVGGDYNASQNMLETLAGAPQDLEWGVFNAKSNPHLAHLEHAPGKFQELVTDHGTFKSVGDIPDALQFGPETRLRQIREFKEQVLAVAQQAGVLTQAVNAPKVAKFRK